MFAGDFFYCIFVVSSISNSEIYKLLLLGEKENQFLKCHQQKRAAKQYTMSDKCISKSKIAHSNLYLGKE